MTTIKAPFNFVPYNEEVYFPKWAEQVSHDIPFSDSKSGIIHITITAKTPIFVRNGHVKDTEEIEFSHYVDNNGQKQYFIPGSSIKGMIRDVFEANSFCKIKQVNDSKFPYRDVSDNEYRDGLKDIRCGYLRKISSGEYILTDHGTPGRISIKDISEDLYNHFCASNLTTKESVSSAKYDFVQKNHIKLPGLFVSDKIRNENKPQGVDNRDFYLPTNSGENAKLGRIVFTGQNSRRVERKIMKIELEQEKDRYIIKGQGNIRNVDLSKISVLAKDAINKFINGEEIDLENGEKRITDVKYVYDRKSEKREWRFIEKDGKYTLNEIQSASGKAYEFIFFEKEKEYELNTSDSCIANFLSMYQYSPDFKDYWLKKLDSKEEIPVFFTGEQIDNKRYKVNNIGLSYLFKYPYHNSVLSAIKGKHKDNKPDLAEIVFGSIDYDIKGRVRFSHAENMGKINPCKDNVKMILASPRASYYPIYLQSGTWKNPSVIRGRKRYVIYEKPMVANTNNNAEVETQFIPLPSESKFAAKIFFHNLNEIELGALLSALTFHGNEQLYHSIGAAKPYGYGKINLNINKIELSNEQGFTEIYKSDWLKYLSCFEDNISKDIENWKETPQIINLQSIAQGIPNDKIFQFRYMEMNIDNPKDNEFVAAKKANEYLPYYSKIIGEANTFISQNVNTLIQNAKVVEKEQQEEKERERLKIEKEFAQNNMAINLGAKYNIGDIIEIEIISEKPKEGIIVGSDIKVQIVTKQMLTIGKRFRGSVKQKAKDNRIVQVEYE